MIRSAQLWFPGYWRQRRHRPVTPTGPRHLILCICDHFEPRHDVDQSRAVERVLTWTREYPKLASELQLIMGRTPRHTFFFPIEKYHRDLLIPLLDLCRQGLAEVEMHLHHDRDTPENLRRAIETGKDRLASLGFLNRDPSGAIRYAFIHGNWALANPHPGGKNCGVSEELQILQDTGCYADFTMPAAPHPAQSRMINSLYYAQQPAARRSHDHGYPAAILATDQPRPPGLLLVQGPLALDWHHRKLGFLPRLENSELAGNNPPTTDRLHLWLKAGIHVIGRPDWLFVKLHTHGCDEARGNLAMLLGEPMRAFLRHLAALHQAGTLHVHLVTARELVNILRAAEEGRNGDPEAFRDYWLQPCQAATSNTSTIHSTTDSCR